MSHFKAIFLIGGPGSGKDFLIHSVLNEYNLTELSLEKTFKAIVDQNNIEELNEFPSVIINGNADNKDKVIVTKAILETMGYDTSMIYVYTSDEVSKSRNDFRISRGAKTFNEETRKIKYDNSVNNMTEYGEMFESFLLFDNSNNFVTVNENVKKEITNWLSELSQIVAGFLVRKPKNKSAVEWVNERVMEIGTPATTQFIRALTPGQVSNHVHTYKQADDKTKHLINKQGDTYKGGVTSAFSRSSERDYQGDDYAAKGVQEKVHHKEKNLKVKQIKSLNYAGITNTAYGSVGAAVSGPAGGTGYSGQNESKKPKVLKKPAKDPGEMFNSKMDFNAGAGWPMAEDKIKKSKKAAPPLPAGEMGVKNLGNPSAVGGMTYKEEKERKKKKYPDVRPPNVGSTQNFGTGDSGSCLTNIVTEKKSFNQLRERISSTVNNVDKELEE